MYNLHVLWLLIAFILSQNKTHYFICSKLQLIKYMLYLELKKSFIIKKF